MKYNWVMGSNPIRVVGGVSKGSKDKSVPRPAQKRDQFRVSNRVWRLSTDVSFMWSFCNVSNHIHVLNSLLLTNLLISYVYRGY